MGRFLAGLALLGLLCAAPARGDDLALAGASTSTLNITAATVVKAAPGRIARISVIVAGAVGTVNDVTTTGAAAAANEVFVIPATVGVYQLDWPMLKGIVIVPGAAQVVSVSWS